MSASRRLVAVCCLALVLGTALAGCMGGDTGGDGDGSELTTEEARHEIQTSLRSIQSGTASVDSRVSVNMTLTNTSGEQPRVGYLTMFLDADLDELIFDMSGETFGGSGGGTGATQISSFTIAQMGKTVMFGGNGTLFSWYNESAEEVKSFDTAGNLTPDAGSGNTGDPTGPFDVIAGNLSNEIESFDSRRITYEGKEALEIESSGGSDGEGPYLRAVIWTEPKRLALLEGRITPEQADASETLDAPGEFKMTFRYGEDARHPLRDDLLRGETLTFRAESLDPFSGGGGSQGNWTNHTIQPSRDVQGGAVALDEVTAIVDRQSAFGEDDTAIRMGLEEGSATAEGNVTLTYDDADGDGMVTEGDELRMERHTQNATFSLTLLDEETGLRYAPSAGAVAALAAVGAAALVAGSRRRG